MIAIARYPAATFAQTIEGQNGNLTWSLSPRLDLGSHVTAIGASAALRYVWAMDLPYPADIGIVAFLSAAALGRNLGIPGPSLEAKGAIGLSLGLGEASAVPATTGYALGRSFGGNLRAIPYLSDDGTPQVNFGWSLHWATDALLLELDYENNMPIDLTGDTRFYMVDKWKTAAIRLAALLPFKDPSGIAHRAGAAAGFLLWTGARDPAIVKHRGESYDLSGWYGAMYSHGIVYGALILDGLELAAGWDSEALRDAIQNNWHWLVDEGSISVLAREARAFLHLSVGLAMSLY